MKYKDIIRNVLSCIVIIIIFGYTIMAEEEEEENRNTSIKFNQIPDIEIRPVNNVINNTTDGSVELFANNPSSNQIDMQVDFLAIIPSEIKLYSDSFSLLEKPGAVIGSFQVDSGQKREMYIKVKSNNMGNYSVQYNVVYYPVGNRIENVKNIFMNYVVESSNNSIPPTIDRTYSDNNDVKIPAKKTAFIPIWNLIAILIMVFLYRKNNK